MRGAIGVLVLLLLMVGMAHAEYELSELVSDQAILAVWAEGLPELLTQLDRTIQREGLREVDAYGDAEVFLRQVAPVVPMLIGIEFREFLRLFGREIALAVYDIHQVKPVAAILTDVGHAPQQAADVIAEVRTLIGAGNKALPSSDTYRGVDHERIDGEGTTIRFGMIENVFVTGLNDGFLRVVDRMMGDDEPIGSSERFRQIEAALGGEGQLRVYADLTKLGPVLRGEGSKTGPVAGAILSSLDSVGLMLDIAGYEQKLVLKAAEPRDAFAKLLYHLVFTERPPMLSSSWLTETEGLWVGANVGDLAGMLDALLSVASTEGSERITDRLARLSDSVGVNVRDEMLPLLSGELGMTLGLPEGRFEPGRHGADVLKLKPVMFLGLNDVDAFTGLLNEMAQSLEQKQLAQLSVVGREQVHGQDILQFFVSSDEHLPGIALTPAATVFREHDGSGLVALSNRAESIGALTETIRDTPIDGRMAMYLPAGDLFRLVANQQSDFLPDAIVQRLARIGPVVVVLSTTSHTIYVSLVSPEASWLNQLVNAAVVKMSLGEMGMDQ